jgi:hypothetical protein
MPATPPLPAGICRSTSGYLWLLKILIPISFATALLDYSGWIHIESAVTRTAAEDYAADYRYLRGIFPERAAR